jgi:hypothetical protein
LTGSNVKLAHVVASDFFGADDREMFQMGVMRLAGFRLAAERLFGKPKRLAAKRAFFPILRASIAEARCISETVASGAALVQSVRARQINPSDSSVNFVIVSWSA